MKTNETKSIEVGATVAYKAPGNEGEGYYRVTRRTRKTVNLGQIFGGKIYFKGVPVEQVREAHAEWSKAWQESETYKCM